MCQPVGLTDPIAPRVSVGIRSVPIFAIVVVHLPRLSRLPYFSYDRLLFSCSDVKYGLLWLTFTYAFFPFHLGTSSLYEKPFGTGLASASTTAFVICCPFRSASVPAADAIIKKVTRSPAGTALIALINLLFFISRYSMISDCWYNCQLQKGQ